MNNAYGDPRKPPKVLHRPFDWVMPSNLKDKTGYNHVAFFVVYAEDTSLLPPVQNYGK